jgi:hypothetical protein
MEDAVTIVDLTTATHIPTHTSAAGHKAKTKAPKKDLTAEEKASSKTRKHGARQVAVREKKATTAKEQPELLMALQD